MLAYDERAAATAPTPVAATYALPTTVTVVEACPVPEYERCIVAAGDGALTLLGAHATGEDGSSINLRPIPSIALEHDGPLDAVAWGYEPLNSELRLVAVGGSAIGVHRIQPNGAMPACERMALPEGSGRARACCVLQRTAERLAVTGDGCTCDVLTLRPDGGGGAAATEQRYRLTSPGVAVCAHSREPQQLMLATEDGSIQFLDLRVPKARPSLSRRLPPGDGDAGGLRDADWSPLDAYMVGGVCGSRWLAWDLRHTSASSPPLSGDAQAAGCTCFRWSPNSARFATAGASSELLVSTIQQADTLPNAWTATPTRLSHDLPTRVASISWLHTHHSTAAAIAGAVDCKVCVWTLPSARG